MSIKYQVFISSTFEDLKHERNQVTGTVLELGHIPVGMEMFSAADEEQWQIIKNTIDQCDYYVVVVAQRYGSLAQDVSFTEKEYDYAISQSIPVLGFVLDTSASWPVSKIETDSEAIRRLDAFRAKVKRKPVSFWTNAEDLRLKVAIAVGKAINTSPRPGWVRGTGTASPEVANELSRLSADNERLRKENVELHQKAAMPAHMIAAATVSKDVEAVRAAMLSRVLIVQVTQDSPKGQTGKEHEYKSNLLTLFAISAPFLLSPKSTKWVSDLLGDRLAARKYKPADSWPIHEYYMREWLTDMLLFGMLDMKEQEVKLFREINPGFIRVEEHWGLTDLGKALLADMRLRPPPPVPSPAVPAPVV